MCNENKKRCFEIFTSNMPDAYIYMVEQRARRYQITMSWFYRAVLYALLKKYPGGLEQNLMIKRPRKFDGNFRKVNICMYGDKSKWMSISRIWQVELGPLLRFGLELYFNNELELDLESTETVKQSKNHQNGKLFIKFFHRNKKGCVCQYQNSAEYYSEKDYWPKNPENNLRLLERGVKNRIYPLKP